MERVSGFSMFEVLGAMMSAAGAKIYALWLAYAEARARRAAEQALEQLSDHTLRDIGLHRSQIGAAVREQRPWS